MMSNALFNKVEYKLSSLVDTIERGEISLPDIQRPFVWKNTRVRDLFDSMYRGYPVGYLLLWKNGRPGDRVIGTGQKQAPPRLVIVDGQQRLTSLYAVVKGEPIVRKNYKKEKISIAFNPLNSQFDVSNAAIRKNKAFIPDISIIWKDSIFKVAESYLSGLKKSYEVNDKEIGKIHDAIQRLHGIQNFSFTTLELAENISEEDVSDIFVRINSKGVQLKQADFILTLMSVFWDKGRVNLEDFCRRTRQPGGKTSSPFNHFIEPMPGQLLRVCINTAFKRARLQHVYSVLRGKNLETGQFSNEARDQQFEKLKDAQARALNPQYWNGFIRCIRAAGFRSKKSISSQSTLLFAYTLYLIGRTEYEADESVLRRAIAQWIFMSLVTARYTGSTDTMMEADLKRLCGAANADQFVEKIQQTCEIALTADFWNITLPEKLATSAANSPFLFAYDAALALLNASLLFSKAKLSEQLDPEINPEPVVRRHLFPAEHLRAAGISSTKEINQIANYAYAEGIKKGARQAPAKYLPNAEKPFSEKELAAMRQYHALPEDWEQMEYKEFLEKRRGLMVQVIRKGYQKITADTSTSTRPEGPDLKKIIENGESDTVEFKSTLRFNLYTNEKDERIELAALKTLAGFLNTEGGRLLIGVSDDGTPVGIEADQFANKDRMKLHLVNIVKTHMNPQTMTCIHADFEDYEGHQIMDIRCEKSGAPVFVKDGHTERFYIRTGPSTEELTISQATSYIQQKFS